jgi:hypothetical protein
MTRSLLISLVLAIALVAAPALAGEIVHFSNGTTMVIEEHSLQDETVRVNLGGQAFMEFPLEQIDRIETTSGRVSLSRSGANRIVPSGNAAAASGYSRPDRRWGQPVDNQQVGDPNVGVSDNGLAVYKPFGANAADNKRGFGLTGRREAMNAPNNTGSAMRGTQRVGNKIVLPGNQSGAPRKQMLIGLEESPTKITPKKKSQ